MWSIEEGVLFKVALLKVSSTVQPAETDAALGEHKDNSIICIHTKWTQDYSQSSYCGYMQSFDAPPLLLRFKSRSYFCQFCFPPFCRLSVVSQKLLIYKLLCQSLSQKLSFSQGFSVLAICLSSGSISFIWNFLLSFFSLFWLRVQEVLKTSRWKGKVCGESSAP